MRNKEMKKVFSALLLMLAFQWCWGVKVVPMKGLLKPEALQADKNQLYITDGWEIKIFSSKDFKPVKTFGRKGEGPGEFKGYMIAYVQPDYIFITGPNKISYYTLDGNFIKERRVRNIFGRFKPIGEGFVGYHKARKEGIMYEYVYLFDSGVKRTVELYQRKYFYQQNSYLNLIEERPPFFHIVDEKIYIDGIDGVIYVFDKTGKKIDAIRLPIKRVPFTSQHKRRFINGLKSRAETRNYYEEVKHLLKFPDYFPPVRMFHVSDNKIYVMTNNEKNGKNEFLVLDMKDRLLKTLFLPISSFDETMIVMTYDVADGMLYHLRDNEETETWEIRVYDLK
jgi:hypothetical protein